MASFHNFLEERWVEANLADGCPKCYGLMEAGETGNASTSSSANSTGSASTIGTLEAELQRTKEQRDFAIAKCQFYEDLLEDMSRMKLMNDPGTL
ncbi:hypothetical protein ACH5RR_032952 [Cinchona calisaya]|uniref:Uncharacterized protein n=1 Tax=Cinchona calisaya TaxID=153742 RepID=A0ABD2YN53_9GENT